LFADCDQNPATTCVEAAKIYEHHRGNRNEIDLLLAIVAYFGFPSPDTLAEWSSAKTTCLDFANKHEDIFWGSNQKPLAAGSTWIKNGIIFVEVMAYRDDDTMTQRLCVVGGGYVQIVPVPENAAYR
jgi:hypothetical protein